MKAYFVFVAYEGGLVVCRVRSACSSIYRKGAVFLIGTKGCPAALLWLCVCVSTEDTYEIHAQNIFVLHRYIMCFHQGCSEIPAPKPFSSCKEGLHRPPPPPCALLSHLTNVCLLPLSHGSCLGLCWRLLTSSFPIRDSEPVCWSAPEEALTAGKVFAMVSVLLTVAFEVVLPNAAAIGA